MAKSFRNLRAGMSPEAQEAAERKAKAILAEMPIYFLLSGQTESPFLQRALSEPIDIRESIFGPMVAQAWGIQGQLRRHAEMVGAASGALPRKGEEGLGSIVDQIGKRGQHVHSLEGARDYATLERH